MIPVADPRLGEAEYARVRDVLDSGQLADGPEVRAFETEFARFCGVDRGVATSNGTTALHAAFEALGVGPGDAVVTTPFSFVASANAIRFVGATPAFADVDPETFTLDPDAVERVVRERDDVVAVLAVHLYGHPAPMDALADLSADHDLALVEDAAQAHGAALDGTRVGALGDAACFSFYPTKNMTTGEGGMVVTDDEALADRVARFVNHGRTATYRHETVGHNFRLSSLAAAIGRVQLEKLPAFNRRRRQNAAYLTDGLADHPAVETPVERAGARHVYHQYTVRCADRDALAAHLDAGGVATGVYYPLPIHRQPAYADVDLTAGVPVAERLADEVLSLPVHPGLSASDRETILERVRSFDP